MKGCFTVILFLVALLIIGVWYVFRPVALGVRYTTEDLKAAQQKLGITREALPAPVNGKTLIVSGSHSVDKMFTSSELTALADNRYKDYAYFPFRNVQIRVNSDGTVEGSATVGFSDAVRYLVALGVSQKDIEEAAKKFKIPNATMPVYLKASGSITNNISSIIVTDAKIANIPVPKNLIDTYAPAMNPLVESVIKARQPSYRVDTLEVLDGAVHFKGTSPDKEQAVRDL